MSENAKFTVGVFAVALCREKGINKCLLNIRTDQERQRELAGLPPDSTALIVDLPGGGVLSSDKSFDDALLRECQKEIGCRIKLLREKFSHPFVSIPLQDIAFVTEAMLEQDDEERLAESQNHVWLTWEQLQAETFFRLPGKLGKNGRMANMIKYILDTTGRFSDLM